MSAPAPITLEQTLARICAERGLTSVSLHCSIMEHRTEPYYYVNVHTAGQCKSANADTLAEAIGKAIVKLNSDVGALPDLVLAA